MANSPQTYRRIAFALFLLAATLAIRWSALERKIWNLDEGSTITMGQQILDGAVLFRDAADNRTPLVPYVKALVLAVAGDWNARAIHVAVTLMLGLTAVLLWLTCRRLGHESVGVFTALAFIALSSGLIPPVDALAAHTGWFLVFFSAAGFWLFGEALVRQTRWTACASGLSFGLAMLAKQPGLLDFGVTVVIVLIVSFDRGKDRPWRLLPWMAAGFAAPLICTLVYFQANNALPDLVFYAWTYNTQYYVPEVPFQQRLAAIHMPYRLFTERMPAAFGLGLVAAVGLLWSVFVRQRREPSRAVLAWLTLGWAASGLLSTVLSGREFAHYSIQVLPGSSLACGWSLAWLWSASKARHRFTPLWLRRTMVSAALLSLATPGIYWLNSADNRDDSGAGLGRLIQRYSRPDERMFIWGYMPELHVFAQRLPSTRFIYVNWVTGMIPWTNIDWFHDTTYAIIPGTPELLRQDLARRPPAIIVDTGSLRGYLKYPLREQDWLWQMVRHDFVEIEPAIASSVGYRIYRRIAETAGETILPADLPIEAGLRLDMPSESAQVDTRITAAYPAGVDSLELYLNGRLYRRVGSLPSDAGTVVFLALLDDLPPGEHHFQAVARGTRTIASNSTVLKVASSPAKQPEGPMLEFEGQALPPLVATNISGVMRRFPGSDFWDAHAPAKVVYARPPGLYGIEIEFMMDDLLAKEPHKWKTDGAEIVVRFENDRREVSEHFRRHLDARVNARDRGLQVAQVLLPLNEPGRVTVWVSPGAESDAASDWVRLKAVRGIGAPARLTFRDAQLSAQRISTPFGMAPMQADGRDVLMVHAPSEIEFELRPGMHQLSGSFGLLPSAWDGPKGSAGATFEIWHLPAEGEPRRFFQMRLNPVHLAKDRGHQHFSVELPKPAAGRIRLVTAPTHPEDNAFNHTYWGDLVAEEFQARISTPDKPLLQESVEARFGYNELDNDRQKVIYVHAPSELVYALPPDLRRISGSIGLLDSAYSGEAVTEGGRFIIETETPDGQRVELWSQELDPQNRSQDRGFIPFSLQIPPGSYRRLILRTDARPGHGFTRAWTYWHGLKLEP